MGGHWSVVCACVCVCVCVHVVCVWVGGWGGGVGVLVVITVGRPLQFYLGCFSVPESDGGKVNRISLAGELRSKTNSFFQSIDST